MYPLPRVLPAMAACLLAGLLLVSLGASQATAEPDPAADVAAPEQGVLEQALLDQMLAPIALYPDALLAQILMAATYPLEVVEAARWSAARPGLEGAAAVEAAADTDWDPSVQALLAFPDILARMSDNLRWTHQLGQAFLAGEQQVMDTVQALREKADSAGNLNDLEHARVYRQNTTIVIEPAQPQIIHVPYYNPMVIYGPWWRPAYPPVYWRPHANYPLSGFYWSSGIRLSSSSLFYSTFDWQRRHVVVLNPRIHIRQPGRIHYRGYYSSGDYRDPGKHGFERWRHRADYRVRKPGERATQPHRYTAGSPRSDRGSHSPTGSYIRPPTRLDSTKSPHRPRIERHTDGKVAAPPRSGTEPPRGNRTESHRAPDRDRSRDHSPRRSQDSGIQFRRGDPHRAPESRSGSGRSSHQGSNAGVERRQAGRSSSTPQRSLRESSQRPSQHTRSHSPQRPAGHGSGRGSSHGSSQRQR